MKRLTTITLALVAILGLTACSNDITNPLAGDKANPVDPSNRNTSPSGQTIADIAAASGFNLLLDAVNYIAETNPDSRTVAGLLDDSELTVFAPTDQAFLDLVNAVAPLLDAEILERDGPFAAIDALLGAGTIETVVGYHVTAGSQRAATVVPQRGENMIKTLILGASFSVDSQGMIQAVGNSARITAADIVATNGMIHVIDAVILPVELELGAATDRNLELLDRGDTP